MHACIEVVQVVTLREPVVRLDALQALDGGYLILLIETFSLVLDCHLPAKWTQTCPPHNLTLMRRSR